MDLRDWRNIYGEIVNLVELAIEIPGNPPIIEFVPYIVTNGEMTDPVSEQVRAANVSWQNRGLNKMLRTIQKGELFQRFRDSHGAYLPHQLDDFRTFLELILRDGSAPADKAKAAQLIEHILPQEPEKAKPLEIARAAASITLLTAYIAGPAVLATNHWSTFEYWVMAGAYVLYLKESSSGAEFACQVSFDICEMGAGNALSALAEECAHRTDFIQGLPLVDGHFYRSRITILAGLLSAWDLSLRIRGKERPKADVVRSFLEARLKEMSMWGESAVPYLFLSGLEIEQNCRPMIAEGLAIQLISEIVAENNTGAKGRGIPAPYYTAEEALKFQYGLDGLNSEQFIGLSYSIAPLIDYLARRWRRRALSSLWYGLTRISWAEYEPAKHAEWFRWKSTNGLLDQRLPGEPQSWEALRTRAETLAVDHLPTTLIQNPAFALWFVLVYPHRFVCATAKLIEDAIWNATG